MAFNINKTYLAKRIRKTSKRKQWIAFFIIFFCIINLLGQAISYLFNAENIPILKSMSETEDEIAYVSNWVVTSERLERFTVTLPGIQGKLSFYPLESGEYLPVFFAVNYSIGKSGLIFGRLIDFTEEQREEITRQLIEQQADQADIPGFLQYKFLATSKEPQFDPIYSISLSGILIYSLFIWFRNRHFKRKPQDHKVFKAFAREGGELENFHQFNDEWENGKALRFKHIVLTENWLFYNGKLRLRLRNISDIVCAFKTKSLDNSILTRWATKKLDVVVGFIDKQQWALKFKKNYTRMDEFKNVLKEKIPNIICGDNDAEIAKLWFNSPKEIIDKFSQNILHESNQKEIKEQKASVAIAENVISKKDAEIIKETIAGYVPEPSSPPTWTRRARKDK